MTENFEQQDNFIELFDDNGNGEMFEFIHALEYEDTDYVVLAPADDDPDEEETGVVILRVVPGDEEDQYESVEDDALLDKLFALFVKEMEELEAFEVE